MDTNCVFVSRSWAMIINEDIFFLSNPLQRRTEVLIATANFFWVIPEPIFCLHTLTLCLKISSYNDYDKSFVIYRKMLKEFSFFKSNKVSFEHKTLSKQIHISNISYAMKLAAEIMLGFVTPKHLMILRPSGLKLPWNVSTIRGERRRFWIQWP